MLAGDNGEGRRCCEEHRYDQGVWSGVKVFAGVTVGVWVIVRVEEMIGVPQVVFEAGNNIILISVPLPLPPSPYRNHGTSDVVCVYQ